MQKSKRFYRPRSTEKGSGLSGQRTNLYLSHKTVAFLKQMSLQSDMNLSSMADYCLQAYINSTDYYWSVEHQKFVLKTQIFFQL